MDYTEEDLMEQLEALRPRLPVDKFNLEEECETHGSLYDEVGELAAIAKGLARTAKNDLDFLEAETKNKVRKTPENFNLLKDKKPTNDAISDAVSVQDDIVVAKAQYVRLMQLADSFSVLQSAVEHRKGNIRNLVTLYVHNYYLAQNQKGMQQDKRELDRDYEKCIAEQRQIEIDERNGPPELPGLAAASYLTYSAVPDGPGLLFITF